jgi:hypothetical protein
MKSKLPNGLAQAFVIGRIYRGWCGFEYWECIFFGSNMDELFNLIKP